MKALRFLPLLLVTAALQAAEPPGVFVHEWGTFTSLQDEAGASLSGLNTDDEPVPLFVHNVAQGLLVGDLNGAFSKGITPKAHGQVTMRLETPVLYFHTPPGYQGTVDVRVDFQGGWLTQFYPTAAATNPGIAKGVFRDLTEKTTSTLVWRGLRLNAGEAGPETAAHVWLAPRAVQASTLQAAEGETEKFLFYRGVGPSGRSVARAAA